jgi:hypothetical protein
MVLYQVYYTYVHTRYGSKILREPRALSLCLSVKFARLIPFSICIPKVNPEIATFLVRLLWFPFSSLLLTNLLVIMSTPYDDHGTAYSDDYTDDPSTNPPDSVRSGRPDSYSTRASDRMPAANDDYQDEYDSAESDEDEEFDDDFYDDDRNAFDNTHEYRNDEAEETRNLKKKEKRDDRDENIGKKVVAAVCCCCICLITILVLVLVLLVFKEEERASTNDGPDNNAPTTPKPTPRPTYPVPPALRPSNQGRPDIFQPWIRNTEAPTISPYPTSVASSNPTVAPTKAPTVTPTISPAPTKKVPPEITIDATQDTYIYVDGFFQYEAFGEEDSFLVQNGLAEYYEFADALGLIAFDLSELPSQGQLTSFNSQAILTLNHLPVAPQFNSRGPSTIDIRKLVSTPMRIETIHGGMLNKEPEASILGINKFTVGINQATVQVDITDLLYPANFTEDGYDKYQLFIMLINNGEEQGDKKWTELEFQDQAGDRFKSVESGEGPRITVTYNAN